ncbi:hypothetical protein vseg_006526 [Gypsophila vaccaria]
MKIVVLSLCLVVFLSYTAAYDPLDPTGNITIKWDILSWTLDGYVAVVTINNLQMHRQIGPPGWQLGWTWAEKEVIWAMVGAQTTEGGDCSKFKVTPHCCSKSPTVIDLLPTASYNQKFTNCCKAGVLAAFGQDPAASSAQFQVSVGLAGTLVETVRLPENFTLLGPGPGYTCGPAKIVPSTHFLGKDSRRKTQALMTWNVTCTYSQFLASKNPSCCVSLSTFYNDTITSCPSCACGCEHKRDCIKSDSKLLKMEGVHTPKKDNSPLLQCTQHMCPIRVHWHIKVNYVGYWRVKISITNFNYRKNFTQWTLVVQHPNMRNVTQVFSFEYKPLLPYGSINDTAMFYGMKYYNEILMEAGKFGSVQSEVLMQKDPDTFTFRRGWAFPHKVYFNGDECMLPPPDSYPYLPNRGMKAPISTLTMIYSFIFVYFIVNTKIH